MVQTPSIAEIAEGRALHDRLRARELYMRVEPLHQRAVAVAGEDRAQFGDAQGLVQLGIAAACDVKVKHLLAAFQHLDLQRVVLRPESLRAL